MCGSAYWCRAATNLTGVDRLCLVGSVPIRRCVAKRKPARDLAEAAGARLDGDTQVLNAPGSREETAKSSEISPPTRDDYNHYKVGDQSPTGREIEVILGRGIDHLVYLAREKKKPAISIAFNEPIPSHLVPALGEFRRLVPLATSGVPRSCRSQAASILGAAINTAFHTSSGEDSLSGFREARSYLELKSTERSRTLYLLMSLLVSAVVFALLSLTYFGVASVSEGTRFVALGAIAGVAGALISILQRGKTLTIGPLASPYHAALLGTIRLTLGMAFGGVVAIAAVADLAFGIAKSSPYALFMVALVGGFGERLVPEVIEDPSASKQIESTGEATDTMS